MTEQNPVTGSADRPEPPKPSNILRPDFAFFDVEASGLHETSYPIEMGWSDDGLNVTSFLIRPAPDWDEEDWLVTAQDIHGISREQIMDEGILIKEAVERLNGCLGGRFVFSDAPRQDMLWLRRLYVAANARINFQISDEPHAAGTHMRPGQHVIPMLLKRYSEAHIFAEQYYPHTHRAGDDAKGMAAAFRMTVDSEFFDEVAAYDRSLWAPLKI